MTEPTAGDDAPAATDKHHPQQQVADGIADARGSSVSLATVTINRPVTEVFATFRDFANLPRFMANVERIDVLDEQRSHWVVKAPADRTVEWDARITEDQADRLIAWTSEDGAEVANSGRVTFQDAGPRGTIVQATILYDPPAGTVGKLVAKLFQREPSIQARRDLRRFKQFMETGEVATGVRNREMHEKEDA